MILKRPYAFLIKYFKLIHIMIAVLLLPIVFKCRDIYQYINQVILTSAIRYDALNHVKFNIYIYIFLAILLLYVIYRLLKFKDKPRKLYIIMIIEYIIIGIFMYVLFTYMRSFVNSVPESKTIRLYRDILLIFLLSQYFFIIMTALRGFGFDIKKFNFAHDIAELNTTSLDSEEIEINTKIDTTNIVRGIRKQKREFGYFFKEFKLYIIIILTVITLIVGTVTYKKLNDKYKVYHEGTSFGEINQIMVSNSYYAIDDKTNYVIIDFYVSKNGRSEKFNPSTMTLLIDKQKYTPDKNICYKFSNLGTCYKKQVVTSKPARYILSYPVDNLNVKKAYIIYTDSYDKTYKVKLNMKSAT